MLGEIFNPGAAGSDCDARFVQAIFHPTAWPRVELFRVSSADHGVHSPLQFLGKGDDVHIAGVTTADREGKVVQRPGMKL